MCVLLHQSLDVRFSVRLAGIQFESRQGVSQRTLREFPKSLVVFAATVWIGVGQGDQTGVFNLFVAPQG